MSMTAIKENVKKNAKKINAIMADVVSTIVIIILYGLSNSIELVTIGFIMIITLKPYILNYISLVLKGEAADLTEENLKLSEQMKNIREIAEYRVQLAAKTGKVPDVIIANKDWVESNESISIIKESTTSEPEVHNDKPVELDDTKI